MVPLVAQHKATAIIQTLHEGGIEKEKKGRNSGATLCGTCVCGRVRGGEGTHEEPPRPPGWGEPVRPPRVEGPGRRSLAVQKPGTQIVRRPRVEADESFVFDVS